MKKGDAQWYEYRAYQAAKSRCTNPNVNNYIRYGGRGIRFCFESFSAFWACLGPRPADCTLERIDNDGNYERGNVCWATRSEQALNRRKHFRTAPRVDTTSGYPGVSHSGKSYRAYYTVDGKQTHVGVFSSAEQAYAARQHELGAAGVI